MRHTYNMKKQKTTVNAPNNLKKIILLLLED